MMKVYADDVGNSREFLTPGKRYKVKSFCFGNANNPQILNDRGWLITLNLKSCAFIKPNKWIVEND